MGFANGSARIKSIPANRSTGRGFAANRVYLDEFAYAEYADDIYQSVSAGRVAGRLSDNRQHAERRRQFVPRSSTRARRALRA
jgi:hypothetical protein